MELLTIKQAAEILAMSPKTFREIISRREIEHYRIGKGKSSIRIDRATLMAYLEASRVEVKAKGSGWKPPAKAPPSDYEASMKILREQFGYK